MKSGILALSLLLFTQALFAQSMRARVNQGNKLFEQDKFEESLTKYQDALLDDPMNEKVIFNKGAALYKLKKYEETISELQKVVGSKDIQLSAKAWHNIGNAYFQQDQLQESIEAYKRALELNPDDYDTKYNLELARAKLKELAEKQPQQSQPDQQQKPSSGDQQQQEQDSQQGDQNDQENQSNQEESQAGQGEEQQQPQDLPELSEKDQISKEEAQRILDALKEDEQKAQERKAPVRGGQRRSGKDW